MFWGKVGRMTFSDVWHEGTTSTVHPLEKSATEAKKTLLTYILFDCCPENLDRKERHETCLLNLLEK